MYRRFKKFIPIESLVQKIRDKEFTTWIDKLTFYHLLFIWAVITVLFGLVYFFFTNGNSYLFRVSEGKAVDKVADTIYFSFVGSTTTGYGDIIPEGFFKFIYPFEVILALMLVAIVTSKLVSIKQDVILNEIYEISFNERINRLRSSMLVFRQSLSRIISRIEEGSIKKREVDDVYVHISPFEDTLNEIDELIETSGKTRFKKVLDTLNIELLFNGILSSFERLSETMNIMEQSKLDWKRDITISLIERCVDINETLFAKLDSKDIPAKIVSDLNSQKNKVIESIKKGLNLPAQQKKEEKILIEKS